VTSGKDACRPESRAEIYRQNTANLAAFERESQASKRAWALLNDNDEATVMSALADAFADNTAPATPVAVDGAECSIVVLVPPET
jgi:hypothetical protein